MAVTRLIRKAKKNRTVSKRRTSQIKFHTAKPVIKNIDVEAIKAEFAAKKKATEKPAAKKVKAAETEQPEA